MSVPHVVKCACCGDSFVAKKKLKSELYACRKKFCKAQVSKMRVAKYKDDVLKVKSVRDENQIWRLDMAIVWKVKDLIVVNDPLELGGWPRGKKFSRDDWHRMYENMTFTHGTILKDALGRLYRADGSL